MTNHSGPYEVRLSDDISAIFLDLTGTPYVGTTQEAYEYIFGQTTFWPPFTVWDHKMIGYRFRTSEDLGIAVCNAYGFAGNMNFESFVQNVSLDKHNYDA